MDRPHLIGRDFAALRPEQILGVLDCGVTRYAPHDFVPHHDRPSAVFLIISVRQYARAKTTRRAEGLPVKMQVPGSFGPSNGSTRIVALNSFCTRSSVSRVPSQCA